MNENKKLMSGIKSKLLAAVCMLLVAVIMVVSSTYAWFTLSTAPEVTGIQTAVGANGALEMLLLTYDATINDWVYNEGMVKDGDDKNTYWGNLVDVSGETGTDYGLSQISLYPSLLNTQDEIIKKGTVFSSSMLKTPVYGADGRVTALDEESTVTGIYQVGKGFIPDEKAYGIRAVGTSSGMTARELAYRAALSAAAIAASNARNAATISLNTNGSKLADIALKQGLNSDATYTKDELRPLYNITAELLGSDGILEKIEEAYMSYIVALFASKAAGTSVAAESVYSTIQSYVDEAKAQENLTVIAGTPAISYLITKIGENLATLGVTIDLGFLSTGGINDLLKTITDVQTSYTSLDTLLKDATKDTFVWNDISTAVGKLVNSSSLTVNGYTVSQVKENTSDFANKVVTAGGIKVIMPTGAGVYADIADHCGNYDANIVISKVAYGTLELENVKASMHTEGKTPSNISTIGGSFTASGSNYGAPVKSESASLPISEYYGYIVDLAFKTNAASSNLLLQTDAKDRIYADNQNEETAGNGSNMIFKSSSVEFDNEDVAALMSYIRIVFFEEVTPEGASSPVNTILATAKLDVVNKQITAEGVKADMYLYTIDELKIFTDGTNTYETYEVVEEGKTEYYLDYYGENKTNITSQLYNTDDAGNRTLKEGFTVSNSSVERKLLKEDAVIKGLTQNTAHNIHVLVYLDGENVKNEHVAATSEGASSMTGSMNLQFASSAALVPMEYKDLHQAATAAPETSPETGGEEQG